MIESLFGFTFHVSHVCQKCLTPEHESDRRAFHLELLYPTQWQGGGQQGFIKLLAQNMSVQQKGRLWCSKCCSLQRVTQKTQVSTLPPILSIHTCLNNHQAMMYFQKSCNSVSNEIKLPSELDLDGRREDDHQSSVDGHNGDKSKGETEINGKEHSSSSHDGGWLPFLIRIKQTGETVTVLETTENAPLPADASPTDAVYQLTTVGCRILDNSSREHFISLINVPPSYLGNNTNPSPFYSNWHLFNDYQIYPVSQEEAVVFDHTWKIPSILHYTRVDSQHLIPSPPQINPITKDVFFTNSSLSRIKTNLKQDLPSSGDLVAIDAEFVALTAEELESRDGKLVTKPARFSLARVSVLRPAPGAPTISAPIFPTLLSEHDNSTKTQLNQTITSFSLMNLHPNNNNHENNHSNHKNNNPQNHQNRDQNENHEDDENHKDNESTTEEILLDDYITTPEPIADYLTRFSGISHGDLDPQVSPHCVTTLKYVYLKLRYLVDQGCIFVGHGLTKDFRIINIQVPPEQVIDTVELFHKDGKRKISLRFLASCLLHIEIQSKTHCSIEDARTALAIYNVYLQLIKESRFEQAINHIYQVGRLINWQTIPRVDL
eukprot:TRINITY_DN1915_c0_g1_i11.p1 TRINITY_DN1915_c0_g1~~TRINITY_DN1915_c0_g1_i11.p1  ORF type:complete len:604 (-),score=108.79 TRINITY_DN1915_c0_g1_i11:151-1962(-)